jgi:hypothetical protein
VTEFCNDFRLICKKQEIEFFVRSPSQRQIQHQKEFFPTRLRRLAEKFYLRDLKIIVKQVKAYRQDLNFLENEKPDIALVRYNARSLSFFFACRKLNIPVVAEINASDTEKTDGDYWRLPFIKKFLGNTHVRDLCDAVFTVAEPLRDEVMKSKAHDLILLNLGGRSDGAMDMLDYIACHPSLSHRPFVTFNGSGTHEEQVDCYNLGVRCYIKSRLNPSVFSTMLNAISLMPFSSIDGTVLQVQAA